MLLCAGILGRYYTDSHDVDEDLKTIIRHGGYWIDGSNAGITHRNLYSAPTSSWDIVASRLIYLS